MFGHRKHRLRELSARLFRLVCFWTLLYYNIKRSRDFFLFVFCWGTLPYYNTKSVRVYFCVFVVPFLTLSRLSLHDALLRTTTVCFTVHATFIFHRTAVFLRALLRYYFARLFFHNDLPKIPLVSCTLVHDIPIKATLISQRSNTQPSHYVLVRCGIFCPYCMCYYSRLFIHTLARYFIRYASTRNLLSRFLAVSSDLRDS